MLRTSTKVALGLATLILPVLFGCPTTVPDGGGSDPPPNRCLDVDCDDGDPCTTDACASLTGSCVNIPLLCNFGGTCISGECVGPCDGVDCDDRTECTVDSCNPVTGSCSHTAIECGDGERCDPTTGLCALSCGTDADCNDGSSHNGVEACDIDSGTCVGGAPPLDSDNDGVVDHLDNCPYHPNMAQGDLDNDGIGDACDSTIDDCLPERDHTRCFSGNVYWFNSCDELTFEVADYCGVGEICTDVSCTPRPDDCLPNHSYKQCFDGDVYWYNNCNIKTDLAEKCANDEICRNALCEPERDECLPNHDYTKCDDGKVFWFNNCDERTDLVENCADYCIDSSCVDCKFDNDCDDGLVCNGTETCDALTSTCQPGTPRCTENGLRCVEPHTNGCAGEKCSSCPQGQTPVENNCQTFAGYRNLGFQEIHGELFLSVNSACSNGNYVEVGSFLDYDFNRIRLCSGHTSTDPRYVTNAYFTSEDSCPTGLSNGSFSTLHATITLCVERTHLDNLGFALAVTDITLTESCPNNGYEAVSGTVNVRDAGRCMTFCTLRGYVD